MKRLCRGPLLLWLLLPLGAACFSSAPPAPPVRFFDPLPPPAADGRAAVPLSLRVDAPPFLGRDFLVRMGPRELAYDAGHRWLAEPRELVEVALVRGLGATPAANAPQLAVSVERFELDVTDTPRARVRWLLAPVGGGAVLVVDESAAASGREPAQLVAAMGEALAAAVADTDRKLRTAGLLPAD